MVGCPFNPLKVQFFPGVPCCGVCLEGNQLEGRDFVGLPTLRQAHVFVSCPMKEAKRVWRIVRLHGLQVRKDLPAVYAQLRAPFGAARWPVVFFP